MESLAVISPLLVVVGAFFFLSFLANRRQRRLVQDTLALHASLRVGDRVLTTSGLHGTIVELGADTVDVEIAPGVVTRWMTPAIQERLDEDGVPATAAQALADGAGDTPRA